MTLQVRPYKESDLSAMTAIWNAVVEEGQAFPQEELLTEQTARMFFSQQSHTAVALAQQEVVGLYILHPNNVGRCGHLANASYAVCASYRGQHIGEALVTDCIAQARMLNFRILQFNAVVKNNVAAQKLYDKLGFCRLGEVPAGFRDKAGVFQDIVLYYLPLV